MTGAITGLVKQASRVSLHPYHTTPHLVPTTSPDNLCKGRVMRDWLALESFDKVVYCGDGGNDFEGAMCVPEVGTRPRRVRVGARPAPRRQYRRSMRGIQHAYQPCLNVSCLGRVERSWPKKVGVWSGGCATLAGGARRRKRVSHVGRPRSSYLLVIVCHNSTLLSLLRLRSACHIQSCQHCYLARTVNSAC